ncbi:MAG: hypothetical protein WAQ25_01660 [Candidatus Saccharimonas sp.]
MSDGFRSARLLNPTDHRVSPEFFDSLLGDCADAAAQLRQKPVRKADLYVVAKPFTALSLWQKTLRVFGRETAAYAVQPAWHVVTSAERYVCLGENGLPYTGLVRFAPHMKLLVPADLDPSLASQVLTGLAALLTEAAQA